MRRLRWIIAAILLLVLLALWVDRRYFRQVGEDNIQGMSKQQLRSRYGEPNWVDDENHWVYYKGFGGGTGIVFKDNVVIHYEVRGAR